VFKSRRFWLDIRIVSLGLRNFEDKIYWIFVRIECEYENWIKVSGGGVKRWTLILMAIIHLATVVCSDTLVGCVTDADTSADTRISFYSKE
jgi:hypothetical protein